MRVSAKSTEFELDLVILEAQTTVDCDTKWTTRDGGLVRYGDMGQRHLRAAVAKIRRDGWRRYRLRGMTHVLDVFDAFTELFDVD